MENLTALIDQTIIDMEEALENEILLLEQLDHAIEKLSEFKEELNKQLKLPEGL